jgi:hypothetical protein
LSDISRQDSLSMGGSGLDTDEDAASEFDSERGDSNRLYAQGSGDKTALVMPRLDSGHASTGCSRRSRKQFQAEHQYKPHIIVVGGSGKPSDSAFSVKAIAYANLQDQIGGKPSRRLGGQLQSQALQHLCLRSRAQVCLASDLLLPSRRILWTYQQRLRCLRPNILLS